MAVMNGLCVDYKLSNSDNRRDDGETQRGCKQDNAFVQVLQSSFKVVVWIQLDG